MKYEDLRPCTAEGRAARFHHFVVVRRKIYEDFSEKPIDLIKAIIEFEDGTVTGVYPNEHFRFTDHDKEESEE